MARSTIRYCTEEHRGVDPLRRVRYSQLQPTFAGGGSARLVTKLRGDYELVAFSPVRPVPSIQDRPVGCGRAFAGRFVGSGYRRLQQQFSAGIAAGQSPPTATTTSAADRNGDGGSAADVADRRIADPHLGGAAASEAISRAAVLRKPGGLGRQRRAALSCRIGGDFAPGMYVSNPPASWPWDNSRIPDRVRDLSQTINNLSDRDKLLQGSVSEADVESLLAKRSRLKKLDEAQQKPRCVFLGGINISSQLPYSHAASRSLDWRASNSLMQFAKGNFADADRAIQCAYYGSRADLQPRGMMVSQLVSINLDSAAMNGIADFTLGQKALTARDCDRLLALLAEQEREAASCADEGLRTEYVTMRNTLHILQQRGMSPQEFRKPRRERGYHVGRPQPGTTPRSGGLAERNFRFRHRIRWSDRVRRDAKRYGANQAME